MRRDSSTGITGGMRAIASCLPFLFLFGDGVRTQTARPCRVSRLRARVDRRRARDARELVGAHALRQPSRRRHAALPHDSVGLPTAELPGHGVAVAASASAASKRGAWACSSGASADVELDRAVDEVDLDRGRPRAALLDNSACASGSCSSLTRVRLRRASAERGARSRGRPSAAWLPPRPSSVSLRGANRRDSSFRANVDDAP